MIPKDKVSASDKYDPVECLREEVNRFKDTNRFSPMTVTNFFVQAGLVLVELDQLRQERDTLKRELASEREYSESLANDICKMEDVLGFKNECHDKYGAFVPTIGPWLERVRDLLAAEGELGDLKESLEQFRAELSTEKELRMVAEKELGDFKTFLSGHMPETYHLHIRVAAEKFLVRLREAEAQLSKANQYEGWQEAVDAGNPLADKLTAMRKRVKELEGENANILKRFRELVKTNEKHYTDACELRYQLTQRDIVLKSAKVALDKIAAWGDGEQVTTSFDEPAAAQIARDTLHQIAEVLPK